MARLMGSSPLTRGKLGPPIRVGDSTRLIPAHAGKTGKRNERIDDYRAHPRSRGENLNAKDTAGRPLGSSPLTRGKLGVRGANRVGGGLIPAHAGKTAPNSVPNSWYSAHPRSRGENRGSP